MDHWEKAKIKLESLRGLKENWDSYGATAIVTGAVDQAARLLDVLKEAGYSCPAVVPSNTGGVVFEWDEPETDNEWDIRVESCI